MSSPILLAGEARHRKIELLASGHLKWDKETHVSFSDGNTDMQVFSTQHSASRTGCWTEPPAAGDRVHTGACAPGSFWHPASLGHRESASLVTP